jgi:proteasome lid subunit RPN8/RPN11
MTRHALTSFALAGIRDGGHEGMAFWAGREHDGSTYILQAIVPDAEHSDQRVMASAAAVGMAARKARESGLGILCQVHSHPGSDTRHSDGDDDLVLLPFEGMLSIVVRDFGLCFSTADEVSVHQFQDGKWVLCSPKSVESGLILVPSLVDLRG